MTFVSVVTPTEKFTLLKSQVKSRQINFQNTDDLQHLSHLIFSFITEQKTKTTMNTEKMTMNRRKTTMNEKIATMNAKKGL